VIYIVTLSSIFCLEAAFIDRACKRKYAAEHDQLSVALLSPLHNKRFSLNGSLRYRINCLEWHYEDLIAGNFYCSSLAIRKAPLK
jgi:hypothetical protein